MAFYYVLATTSMFGLVAAMTTLNYISDRTIRQRADQRLAEIETLSRALSDICALDHTLKEVKHRGKGIDKETFSVLLREARRSRQIDSKEVDLLFDVFDKVKDGVIGSEDINFIESMLESQRPSKAIPSGAEKTQ